MRIYLNLNLSFSFFFDYCNYSVPGRTLANSTPRDKYVSLTFESSMKLGFELDYKLEYHFYYEMMMMGLGLVALKILCSE